MITEDKIVQLIRLAAQAPSGHNTQPWLFGYSENIITIRPDFTRALPVVDSDHHALYISLGCALENLVIAAREAGFEANANLVPEETGTSIEIRLTEAANPEKSDLFDMIEKRQVTRKAFRHEVVSADTLQLLLQKMEEPGVSVRVFSGQHQMEPLIPYIIEGSNLQFENRDFVTELISWIRFNERAARHSGDGIWSSSMGLPNVPRWLGLFFMQTFATAKSEAKRWEKMVKNSSGLLLFSVEKNNTEHWISLGRAFQRFGLTATRMNLVHAHVNMPCEEVVVREKLMQHLQLKDQTPLLLLRFGYADPMPYSFRRKVSDVITN